MDAIQQNINLHKQTLFNLVNKLINTISIYEEININVEIKKESEYLNSLLIIKQNNLLNQININNNMNFNPFLFQPNPMMNLVQNNQMDNYCFNMGNSQFELNSNVNNLDSENKNKISFINVIFSHARGMNTTVVCKSNEKVSEMIKKYREKSNDYNKNVFRMNNDIPLNISSNLTVIEMCNNYFFGQSNIKIKVDPIGELTAGFKNFNSNY